MLLTALAADPPAAIDENEPVATVALRQTLPRDARLPLALSRASIPDSS